MFKKLKGTTRLHLLTYTLIVVFLAGVAWAGVTNLDSLILRPTIDDDYSLKLQNRDGTDVVTVTHEGDAAFTKPVTLTDALYRSGVSPSPTAKRGYVLDGTEGNIVYIDTTATGIDLDECEYGVGPTDGAGVTVEYPVPSSALNGWTVEVRKIESGSTDFFIVIGNYSNSGVSGVYLMDIAGVSGCTDGTGDVGTYALDGDFDSITLTCYYVTAGVSGYLYEKRVVDGAVL